MARARRFYEFDGYGRCAIEFAELRSVALFGTTSILDVYGDEVCVLVYVHAEHGGYVGLRLFVRTVDLAPILFADWRTKGDTTPIVWAREIAGAAA